MSYLRINLLVFLLLLTGLSACGNRYEVDGNEVYYTSWNEGSGSHKALMPGADAASFQILKNSRYAKDKNHAYYSGRTIAGAEVSSFESVLDYYAKDSHSAYFEDKEIPGADGKTFVVLDRGPYAKDNKDYYYNALALHISDYSTFKKISNTCFLDKSFYYMLSSGGTQISFKRFPVGDYTSFVLLDGDYAKDKVNVYCAGEIVPGADPKTFVVVDYQKGKDAHNEYLGTTKVGNLALLKHIAHGYYTDGLAVYFVNDKIEGADPKYFSVYNQYWTKDDSAVYYNGKKARFLDYSSFKYLIGQYVKDSKNVFYADTLLTGADPQSAEAVKWDWIKDKSNYFYTGHKIEGIDYASFRVLENDYSKDKFRVFFQLKKAEGADPVSFDTTRMTYGGRDKNATYYMGERITQ